MVFGYQHHNLCQSKLASRTEETEFKILLTCIVIYQYNSANQTLPTASRHNTHKNTPTAVRRVRPDEQKSAQNINRNKLKVNSASC
jgi:hypothetical protein